MRSSMAMQSARSMGHAAPFRSASTGPRAVCRVQATISAEKTNLRAASNALAIKGAAVAVAAAAAALLSLAPPAALAIGPIAEDAQRCTVSNLDKFAETRSKFSQEASGGNMTEALVDVRGCNFSGKDLSGKVLSGVFLQNSNFAGAKLVGSQMARADARSADLSNVDFTDVNAYGTRFDGANLEGAQFENAILTGATFGKDPATGQFANLKGAHFEGALLSSSDIQRACENPTLDPATRRGELGCKK